MEIYCEPGKLKEIFKEAITEIIEERKDMFYELFSEIIEDVALVNAIREGEKSEIVSGDEILKLLEGSEWK